ncbi:hypothetical protein L3Q65_00960 (plasmid) [Amycolatopsis sp. FU40]|uniref:hypothetical protein n=1 Tax=Amycolatopsis sp. FU40 TaxID=2914159 RepID=UPI001F1B8A5E|nr:hypothetical protein [Amycolatopsis sp. FU40]UKD50895.1 hypothetical protein L3Q65_00960 [Amycolatopsis sp. FU40]
MTVTSARPTGPQVPLARIAWNLPACAPHWLSDTELAAVTAWMADNHLDRATAQTPIEVADGKITYGQDRSPDTVRAAHRDIVAVTVPLRTPPPEVAQPRCSPAVLAKLQAVFDDHEWSAGYGGVCVDCSETYADAGQLRCRRDDAVAWPCPPVRAALAAAGLAVAPGTPDRILGDCLDPADNARAGLAVPGIGGIGS